MKILIIGVGSIGERHLKNLLKLGYKDIYLSDAFSGRRRNLEEKYYFSVYLNWRLALEKVKPQAVFVCTPANSHISIAKAALSAGADVFIEKPLSVNLKGVDGLISFVKKNKKTVMVACNYLFHGGFQKLKKVLASGLYGKPFFARATVSYYLPTARKNSNYKNIYAAKKSQGGGVILDSGSHAVNYLSALLGPIVKGNAVAGKSHFLGIQSEEVAELLLEHKNGIVSVAWLDYLRKKPVHQIEIATDKGSLVLDFKNNSLVFEDDKKKKVIYRGNGDANQMFLDELKHFFDCLKKRKKPIQDLEGAKEVLKILV